MKNHKNYCLFIVHLLYSFTW